MNLDNISFGKIVQIREELLKAQAAGQKVFRFESGDPYPNIPVPAKVEIVRGLENDFTHYIPNDGIPVLRKAVSLKFKRERNIEVSPDQIYITNGAMHALFCVFACMLKQGDEVIVPDPMWTEVVENIRLAGGVPVYAPIKDYASGDLKDYITVRTKAIFVNTPHNPTGLVLDKKSLIKIIDVAKKNKLEIVSDEAYEHVTYDQEHHSMTAMDSDVIGVFSCSKSYAMSGLRVGYIVAPENKVFQSRISKLLRCSINGVNSLAQMAAAAAINSNISLNEYRASREVIVSALSGINGLTFDMPEGAFYLWCNINLPKVENSGDLMSDYLAKFGIGSAPSSAFSDTIKNAIRFAYSCHPAMVNEGAPILRQRVIEFMEQHR